VAFYDGKIALSHEVAVFVDRLVRVAELLVLMAANLEDHGQVALLVQELVLFQVLYFTLREIRHGLEAYGLKFPILVAFLAESQL
jgi:hypothetical protein